MPGAGEEIVCKESLLAKKERKQSVFSAFTTYIQTFLRENGANRKFLMLCDILQKVKKVNIQASKKF